MSGEHTHPDLAPAAALEALAGLVQHLTARVDSVADDLRGIGTRVDVLEQASPADPQPQRPIRFASIDEARQTLSLPADANYVTWSHGDADLDSVLRQLGTNDLLVLPERDEPYWVDSSAGFRVDNTRRVDGVTWPITAGGYWFNMARARGRGIVGLGPRTVIKVRPSAFTQGPQPDRPRYRYDLKGNQTELVGAQESIIGFALADSYAGNFSMLDTPDFGGVAFDALKFHKGGTAERIWFRGAHRGFKGAPNGETAAINMLGPYRISHVEVDCRDSAGNRVGTSPIMLNRSPGGGLIEHSYLHHAVVGMPTYWECYGDHVWRNVVTEDHGGPSLNLESLGRDRAGNVLGFHLLAEDCAFLDPSSVDPSRGRHLNVGVEYTSIKVDLLRCQVTGARVPGSLVVQLYGSQRQLQLDADITATAPDGTPWPVRVYR